MRWLFFCLKILFFQNIENQGFTNKSIGYKAANDVVKARLA